MKKNQQKDHYTVALEGIRSDFKVFGEALGSMQEDVSDLKEKVGDIDTRLAEVESDVSSIKTEQEMVRITRVPKNKFRFLETRVSRLEKKVKTSK